MMAVLSVRVREYLFQSSNSRGRLCTPPLNWEEDEPVEGTTPVRIAAFTVVLSGMRPV